MYRNDLVPDDRLGCVPEDDNPYLIDYPVSATWARYYTTKGYEVPMRLIQFGDYEDRREYISWLTGQPEDQSSVVVELRQEIIRLRESLERRQPRQEFRQALPTMPRQSSAEPLARQAKPEAAKKELRGIEL